MCTTGSAHGVYRARVIVQAFCGSVTSCSSNNLRTSLVTTATECLKCRGTHNPNWAAQAPGSHSGCLSVAIVELRHLIASLGVSRLRTRPSGVYLSIREESARLNQGALLDPERYGGG